MTEFLATIAFLDVSVLYPALLRNISMRLALHGLFRAHWSVQVHEEWIGALLRNCSDLDRARFEHTRLLMDRHIRDVLVEGYEHRIQTLTLPDAEDRHVLAAALHCRASVIVTANLRDFPSETLFWDGIEARHPDPFILGLFNSAPKPVIAALRQLRGSFKNPSQTALDLLATMQRQGLEASADALGPFADQLD